MMATAIVEGIEIGGDPGEVLTALDQPSTPRSQPESKQQLR